MTAKRKQLKKEWVAYLKLLKAYEQTVRDFIQSLQDDGDVSTQDDGTGGTTPPGGPPPPPNKP